MIAFTRRNTGFTRKRLKKLSRQSKVARFNLGLISTTENLDEKLIGLAQNNCGPHADNYCLDQNSLPHITLSHFEASENVARAIFQETTRFAVQAIPIRFSHLYFRQGWATHEKFVWCGLAVVPRDDIIDLHRRACQLIAGHKITALTPPGAYFPHVTLARMRSVAQISHWPDPGFWQANASFSLKLGTADMYGRWTKTL
jgi:2'-5' RNA ligase